MALDEKSPPTSPEPISPEPISVAMLLYPAFTALDLIGPHQVFHGLPGIEIDLIAKQGGPIVTDSGITITPGRDFHDCRDRYDVVFVPGGPSTYQVLQDAETLAFVARLGQTARYVTSVCTGSLILAAAGLLDDTRAATHWAFRDCLAPLGAIPVDERVVIDGNRVTGGGVTAGIDFGLRLAALLTDQETAESIQLIMEYNPAPPFDSGHPSRATPDVLARVRTRLAGSVAEAMRAADQVEPS